MSGLKSTILPFVSMTLFASVLFGLMQGSLGSSCPAKSILAVINLPYRLSCELTIERFK